MMARRLLKPIYVQLGTKRNCFVRHLSVSRVCQQQNEPQRELFGPEHQQLRENLRKIIDKDINPYVNEWEEARMFPAKDVFKTLGNAGYLGVTKPPEYGGLGLDYSYSMAVAEELGHINCGGVPMAIGVQTDMATPALARFGSDKLKREFLAPSISGDMVACLGVSEVGAGSDVSSIFTKASRTGDDLIINGGKMWITNGTQADWMCLLANTGQGKAHENKSLICLPMDLPGIQIAKKIEKIGMRCSDTAQIFFEDVRVPASYIIGEDGMGFTYQMLQFQEERLFGAVLEAGDVEHIPILSNQVAHICLAELETDIESLRSPILVPLQKMIQETAAYTAQRKAFGKPILSNQIVHFRLAELETEIESLRSLVYRAVALYMEGNDVTKLASMCKLKAGRLAREVCDSCLQYWGGMGYTEEVLISRMYRDFRLLSIGAGADEVMLSIICKYMNILPKSS